MQSPIPQFHSEEAGVMAALNRSALADARVFAVSLIGGPGCGKTTLIDATIEYFMPEVHVGAICGNGVSCRDAGRVATHDSRIVQVNTGEGGELSPGHVHNALACLDLEWLDLLFIENLGALGVPGLRDFGQGATALVFGLDAGDDKADRHPGLVRDADLVVLNKMDLSGSVPFDLQAFERDVRRLNPRADVLELSALRRAGTGRWYDWLRGRMTEACMDASHWFG